MRQQTEVAPTTVVHLVIQTKCVCMLLYAHSCVLVPPSAVCVQALMMKHGEGQHGMKN